MDIEGFGDEDLSQALGTETQGTPEEPDTDSLFATTTSRPKSTHGAPNIATGSMNITNVGWGGELGTQKIDFNESASTDDELPEEEKGNEVNATGEQVVIPKLNQKSFSGDDGESVDSQDTEKTEVLNDPDSCEIQLDVGDTDESHKKAIDASSHKEAIDTSSYSSHKEALDASSHKNAIDASSDKKAIDASSGKKAIDASSDKKAIDASSHKETTHVQRLKAFPETGSANEARTTQKREAGNAEAIASKTGSPSFTTSTDSNQAIPETAMKPTKLTAANKHVVVSETKDSAVVVENSATDQVVDKHSKQNTSKIATTTLRNAKGTRMDSDQDSPPSKIEVVIESNTQVVTTGPRVIHGSRCHSEARPKRKFASAKSEKNTKTSSEFDFDDGDTSEEECDVNPTNLKQKLWKASDGVAMVAPVEVVGTSVVDNVVKDQPAYETTSQDTNASSLATPTESQCQLASSDSIQTQTQTQREKETRNVTNTPKTKATESKRIVAPKADYDIELDLQYKQKQKAPTLAKEPKGAAQERVVVQVTEKQSSTSKKEAAKKRTQTAPIVNRRKKYKNWSLVADRSSRRTAPDAIDDNQLGLRCFEHLKSKGWTYATGSKDVSWYYLKPGVQKKEAELGVDMFAGELHLLEYLRIHDKELIDQVTATFSRPERSSESGKKTRSRSGSKHSESSESTKRMKPSSKKVSNANAANSDTRSTSSKQSTTKQIAKGSSRNKNARTSTSEKVTRRNSSTRRAKSKGTPVSDPGASSRKSNAHHVEVRKSKTFPRDTSHSTPTALGEPQLSHITTVGYPLLWKKLQPLLTSLKWTWKKGSGLVDWIYIPPEPVTFQSQRTHSFESPDDVLRYWVEHPDGLPKSLAKSLSRLKHGTPLGSTSDASDLERETVIGTSSYKLSNDSFRDCMFLITGLQEGAVGTLEESLPKRISDIITSHGGTVLKGIPDEKGLSGKRLITIAGPDSYRRPKFAAALAYRIPPLHPWWLIDTEEKGYIQPWQSYQLPVGPVDKTTGSASIVNLGIDPKAKSDSQILPPSQDTTDIFRGWTFFLGKEVGAMSGYGTILKIAGANVVVNPVQTRKVHDRCAVLVLPGPDIDNKGNSITKLAKQRHIPVVAVDWVLDCLQQQAASTESLSSKGFQNVFSTWLDNIPSALPEEFVTMAGKANKTRLNWVFPPIKEKSDGCQYYTSLKYGLNRYDIGDVIVHYPLLTDREALEYQVPRANCEQLQFGRIRRFVKECTGIWRVEVELMTLVDLGDKKFGVYLVETSSTLRFPADQIAGKIVCLENEDAKDKCYCDPKLSWWNRVFVLVTDPVL